MSFISLSDLIRASITKAMALNKPVAVCRDGWFDGRRWRFWWEA